jgi:hypothetical protein
MSCGALNLNLPAFQILESQNEGIVFNNLQRQGTVRLVGDYNQGMVN